MNHPFANLIGLQIQSMGAGTSACSVVIDAARHHNPHGMTDGSVLFALADTGMGAALASVLAEGEICVTIEVKINYFRAAREGVIHCRTELVHRGKAVANLQSSLFCGDKLVAQANGSFAIRQR